MNTTIEFGNITIIERSTKRRNGVYHTCYDILVAGKLHALTVSVPDVRLAVLAALGYEALGLNNDFATFAAKMLEIDGQIWHASN